jgi:hypothetical protein
MRNATMARTLCLPEAVYMELTSVSEELTLMTKKPISLSMTIDLLIEVYRAHMNNACALDAFSQQLASLNILSPEEFDKVWDDVPPTGLGKKGDISGRKKKPKSS